MSTVAEKNRLLRDFFPCRFHFVLVFIGLRLLFGRCPFPQWLSGTLAFGRYISGVANMPGDPIRHAWHGLDTISVHVYMLYMLYMYDVDCRSKCG